MNMKITKEIYDKIIENKKELVKQELDRLWVDMTSEYWAYTARNWNTESIRKYINK